MRVLLICFFVVIASWFTLDAQDEMLPQQDDLQISLLTCDAGDGIDMLFGHSSIRVQDGINDIVYNYGTFNFNTPGFVLKFMRGKLPYTLSTNTVERFLGNYHYEKRSVREQILLLTPQEKEKVVRFLINNAKPENREYNYDFFFDNCSTRISDLLKQNVERVEFPSYKNEITYRDMLHEFLAGSPWYEYGIDLIIGAKADRIADVEGQMFLPQYLQDHFANTTVSKKPLVAASNPIFLFEEERLARLTPPGFTPLILFIILICIWTVLYYLKKLRALRLLNSMVFFILTIMSLVIIFLWFFTDHSTTKLNFNLLWISPLSLLLMLKGKQWVVTIVHVLIILDLVALLGMMSGIIPQYHPSPVMALFVLLVLGIHLVLLKDDLNVTKVSQGAT